MRTPKPTLMLNPGPPIQWVMCSLNTCFLLRLWEASPASHVEICKCSNFGGLGSGVLRAPADLSPALAVCQSRPEPLAVIDSQYTTLRWLWRVDLCGETSRVRAPPASCFRSSGPPGPRAHPTWPVLPVQPGDDVTHNTFRAMAAVPPAPEGATSRTVPALAQRPLASGGRAIPVPALQDPACSVSRKSHPHPCTSNCPGPRPMLSSPRLSGGLAHNAQPRPSPEPAKSPHAHCTCFFHPDPYIAESRAQLGVHCTSLIFIQAVGNLHPRAFPSTRARRFATSHPALLHCWLVASTKGTLPTVLLPHPNIAWSRQALSYTLHPQIYPLILLRPLAVGSPALPLFLLHFFSTGSVHPIRLTKAWLSSPHPVSHRLAV